MNIEDLTIKQARELAVLFGGSKCDTLSPWDIGRAYLFRCVTHYQIGIVDHVGEQEIILRSAGWCACTERFEETLRTGALREYEPSPTGLAIIGRGAHVDSWPWLHPLPTKVIG